MSYHVYSLPPSLLDTLTPRNLLSISQSRPPSPEAAPIQSQAARSCTICPGPAATFADADQQRTHYKSDWHRYNLKLRPSQPRVSEPDFARLVDALEDSLSGSASDDDDDDDSDDNDDGKADTKDAVNTLLQKQRALACSRSPSPTAPRGPPQTALAWFHSPPSTQLGVYKALFPSRPNAHLDALREMQAPVRGGRTWALFMVAGGHFAGAVVRVSPPEEDEDDDDSPAKRKKQKKQKPDTEVLLHKTFHRYTTRRKQGGSQSLNDAAKGAAHSAGAQLRRYGEQALRDDIRGLLAAWEAEIGACERVWIRASAAGRRIFLDGEGVLAKGDERLRTFPFPTRRPTQSELTRCLHELTRAKVSHLTEDALRAQDEAFLASLPKPKPVPAPAPPVPAPPPAVKLSREEEALREKWGKLLEMVRRGRLEPLRAFWARECPTPDANGDTASGFERGVDTPIPAWAGERRAGTLLQLAAHAGHEDLTRWLLEDLRADPTAPAPLPSAAAVPAQSAEPEDGDSEPGADGPDDDAPALPLAPGARRTAYDLARTRAVRNVFRRAAAAHPARWDWLGAARVPSALSKEMEERMEEKKKGRRRGLKERVREREAKERERERERDKAVAEQAKAEQAAAVVVRGREDTGPRRLGSAAGAAAQEAMAGLTPEMRARVERERRARAAEARIKALSGK